jgi:hypothetical protein
MSQLPEGLSVCADCGDVRGKTPDGMLSVCLCQGVVCTWCGARGRRPISDHYDPRAGWLHTPYFMAAHACPPGTHARDGKQFRVPPADEDLQAYSDAVTRVTLAELEARTAIRLGPEADRPGSMTARQEARGHGGAARRDGGPTR